MPEHLRAFVVIFVLSATVLIGLKRWKPLPIEARDYSNWAKFWLLVTCAGYLAHNYWIFAAAVAGICLVMVPKRADSAVAVYFLLLPTLPILSIEIPGFGGLRFLIDLTYPRILALFLLLPLALRLRGGTDANGRRGYFPSDKYVMFYLGLVAVLSFRDNTLTNSLRTMFYIFIDFYLPYYVVSRGLTSIRSFRLAFAAVLTSALVISMMAVFESLRDWNLYRGVIRTLNAKPPLTTGLSVERAGMTRVATTFESPISLGFFFVHGFAALAFLRRHIESKLLAYGMILALGLGLFFTLSRGPWIGLLVYFSVFTIFGGRQYAKPVATGALLVAVGLFVLDSIDGAKFVELIPFIGGTGGAGGEAGATVNFRQKLWSHSLLVIERYFWFGSTNYLAEPEMQALRAGSGLIDIVNSYVSIALASGVLGLALFATLFGSILLNVLRSIQRSASFDPEHGVLGRTVLSLLVASLVIIATTSSIGLVPIYYWTSAGLGAAYVNFIRGEQRTRLSSQSPNDAQSYSTIIAET